MSKTKLHLAESVEDVGVNIKLVDKGDIKAFISLDFGELSIKGFRLRDSQFEDPITRKLWLVPPVYFDSLKKAHPIVFLTDKEKWDELKRHIMQKYEEAVERGVFGDNDVDPETEEIIKSL